MIPYPRSSSGPSSTRDVRLVGVGNAGVHLADRITMTGTPSFEVIAMNTDAQSLASSVAPKKVALGPVATRGLGTGGDPELGYEAGQESLEEICAALRGADIVFLCAGLGGGTACGAASIIAAAARDAGAVVFSIVTSPFAFEGRRRAAQAVEALATLREYSAAVIHFENDRMAELSSPREGIEETFGTADNCLVSCALALAAMLEGGEPMPVGLSDLLAAVKGGGTLFGHGESRGDNRAHEALESALKNPLLDRGRLLGDSHAVIAHISGPPSLSFSEVAAIMRELSKQTSDTTRLFLGVSATADPDRPVSVTLLGSLAPDGQEAPVQASAPRRVPEPARPVAEPEEPPAEDAEVPEPVKPLFVEPPPPPPEKPPVSRPVPREPTKPLATKPASPKIKQETLQFEPVTRGRFEKSEPTIVEGEDLDVPTFLRLRGKAK